MPVFCFVRWRQVQVGWCRPLAGNPQWTEQPASGRLYHSVGSHPARMQVFCFARWRRVQAG